MIHEVANIIEGYENIYFKLEQDLRHSGQNHLINVEQELDYILAQTCVIYSGIGIDALEKYQNTLNATRALIIFLKVNKDRLVN